jgi:hypothetical protein
LNTGGLTVHQKGYGIFKKQEKQWKKKKEGREGGREREREKEERGGAGMVNRCPGKPL